MVLNPTQLLGITTEYMRNHRSKASRNKHFNNFSTFVIE
jgi:hypothetical protein